MFKNVELAARNEAFGDIQLKNNTGGSWRVSARVIPQQEQNTETMTAQSPKFTSLFQHEIDLTGKKQLYSSFCHLLLPLRNTYGK